MFIAIKGWLLNLSHNFLQILRGKVDVAREKPLSGQLIELLAQWRCTLGAPQTPAGLQAVCEPEGAGVRPSLREW